MFASQAKQRTRTKIRGSFCIIYTSCNQRHGPLSSTTAFPDYLWSC